MIAGNALIIGDGQNIKTKSIFLFKNLFIPNMNEFKKKLK